MNQLSSRKSEETTTTEPPDINTTIITTTDATTEQPTPMKPNETERTTDDEGITASTARIEDAKAEDTEDKQTDKMDTMLYQDFANEADKRKVFVTEQMTGM